MNKFYKVVFCKTTGVMKAVSETAKSGKKTKSISIAAGVLSAGVIFSSTAFAAAGDPLIEGEASGLQALSVGEDNIVDGNRSTAVGNNNNINGESNTAIGSGNMIRPTEIYWWDGEQEEITLRPSISSTVVGLQNTIVGNESIASGLFNRVDGDNVTVTGGRNNVVARESGAYGQNNSISAQAIVPMFYRVDDGMALRMKPTYAISSGSYAYGNGNEVVGDKSHTVGNSNSLSGEDNGVLGNGNILASGDSGFNEPMARLGSEFGVRSIGWDSNGSFLVGNQNEVTANNTHAVGNQNTIRNDRNVTIGNHNTVEFYDDGFSNERQISNDNTSTAIVGEDNLISAAGVHIVGTENNIDQKNSYVMGGDNYISRVDGMFSESARDGSNVFGTNNSVYAQSSSILGSQNAIFEDSHLAVVAGSENRVTGVMSSVVGSQNEIKKDMGGAHGVANRIVGNSGIIRLIEEAMIEAEEFGGEFQGIDLDGDGIKDITSFEEMEQLQAKVLASGSYAYGNINNIAGENVQSLGNNNEVSGDNNIGVGSNNRIGQVGGMVGNSDAVLETIKFNDSATYGDGNTINANSAQTIGNQNRLEKDFSSITGYNNTVTQGLDGELVDVTIEQQRLAGTFVSGNDNLIESHGGHVSGSGNEFQADRATLSGSENTVIGNEGHVVGNDNNVYGSSNNGFGNNNVIGKVMNGDYSSVDSSHVVGNNNTIEGNLSSAFGNENTVSGDESSVVGLSNITDGEGSLILGNYNENKSSMTTMVGGYNNIDNDYSDNVVAVGQNNRMSGNQAAAFGNNNSIEKDASGAIGVENYIAGGFDSDGLAGEGLNGMGDAIDYNKYIERGSYAQGNKNDVRGDTTHVYGYQNAVLGDKASVVGANNSVSGNGTQVIGNDNLVGYNNDGMPQYGDNIAVLGSKNTVEAENSFVVGSNNTVDRGADGSLIFGSNASSSVQNGVAIGNGSTVDRENTVSFGSAGEERQLTNVADATETKDAVNLGQLNASLRDTTGGKNLTATRTDTGYEVALNDAITLDSVTTGNTVVNTDGVRAGDVFLSSTTGLDNAGNRVTSVGDAIIRSDAVNYGQFQDGLAGTIKSVTGDENITATTDAEKNVSLVLNKDLVADSLTAGDTVINNAGFTNGATTLGNTGLKVGDVTVSSAGLDNAGNRVTNVGDAIKNSDAVNYGQFKAGLTDTTAGKNIAVKRTDTGYEVSTVEDMTLTSVKTGDTLINNAGFTNGATTVGGAGLKVGDVTVSSVGLDNAGNRVTSVGDATLRSDAVNYGQFTDGLAGTIKSVTGDENITATTDAEKNVSLVLNRNLDVDSVTAGSNVFDSSGLQIGGVTIGDEVGIYAGDMRVRGVANAVEATDAVNLGQVSVIDDRLTNENIAQNTIITNNTNAINKGFNVGNGVTSNKFELGDTVDITAGKNSKVTTTDTGVEVSVADDLVVTTVTTGAASMSADGFKAGDVFLSSTNGLDNAGNRVTSVGDATLRSDAVNYGQFQDGLAGTIKSVTGDENITATTDAEKNVSLVLNKDIAIDSMTAGDTLINNAGFTNGATTLGNTGLKVGDVTVSSVGLDNAGNRVTSVGDATLRSDAVNYGQFTDGLAGTIKSVTGDENITATTDANKNVSLVLNKDITVDSMMAGSNVFNTEGLNIGSVNISNESGIYAGNKKVSGVADATNRDDAVNYGQFQDGLAGTIKSVTGDENITATTDANKNVSLVLNKDITVDSMMAGDTLINNAGFTNGATTLGNTGLKVGDVTVSSVGLDNAGNRVTSVGDATLRSDAVNYGQFTDGLAGTIKSVTGDENITATTDANKNVSLVLNKDITVDSMMAGDTLINNAGFTNGATTLGNTGLKVGDVTVSSAGLDNAGNRVTSVGNAIIRSDAVNYGQFQDGLAGTIKSVTGDENIIATTDAEKNVTLNLKKDIAIDSMTAGNTVINNNGMMVGDTFFGATGVRTGDVILSSTSGLYNGGYRVTGVDRAVEGTDAVNFDQFNEALNKITPTTIDGDKNITVTNNGKGYDVALNKDVAVDSVTTGGTTVNNDGLTTGDVTVSSNGLSNGGNRVTNISDAVEGSDAVSFDQFNKKFDSLVPTDIKGDENITVNKTDTGFDIGLNKDIAVDSVTVGNTSITNDGLTVGDVSVTANGLNNGGNTVKGVGDGVLRDDAVNKGQLDDLEARQNIKNEAQDIIINNKLDRDEFLKDQERQDALLEGKADKAELDKTNANVSNNTTNINKHSNILEAHDKELGRLEDVKADKAELDKTNIKVQENADKNKDQDKTLGEHKTELDRLEDVKADKKDLEAKADKTYVDKEITATNDRFSEINKENNAKFDKFEKAQSTIDSSQNVRIDRNEQAIADLGYQVDNLEGKLSAGIASSVAMASMPSSFIKGEARIAGGFGYYNGQNAIAIGITGATETGDYSYKLGSSYTQEGGAVVGAGISYRLW